MHVIKLTHEQCGFEYAVSNLSPQYYGPFPDVAKAEQVFRVKLWTRGHQNYWTANQGPTRLIHAEILPLETMSEGECANPDTLPSGGVYYN